MALAVMMKYFSSHLSHQLPEAISTMFPTVLMLPDRVWDVHMSGQKPWFIYKQMQAASLIEL